MWTSNGRRTLGGFGPWFEDADEVTALIGVGVGDPVEDTHHVSYRLAFGPLTVSTPRSSRSTPAATGSRSPICGSSARVSGRKGVLRWCSKRVPKHISGSDSHPADPRSVAGCSVAPTAGRCWWWLPVPTTGRTRTVGEDPGVVCRTVTVQIPCVGRAGRRPGRVEGEPGRKVPLVRPASGSEDPAACRTRAGGR